MICYLTECKEGILLGFQVPTEGEKGSVQIIPLRRTRWRR